MIMNQKVNRNEQTIVINFNNIEEFSDVVEVLKDIQVEYAGFDSKRKKQQRLIEDMQNHIAELSKEEDFE